LLSPRGTPCPVRCHRRSELTVFAFRHDMQEHLMLRRSIKCRKDETGGARFRLWSWRRGRFAKPLLDAGIKSSVRQAGDEDRQVATRELDVLVAFRGQVVTQGLR